MQTNSSRKLPELIAGIFQETGIPLNQETGRDLLFYFKELSRWNRVTNLTGIKDPEALVIKHLGDTLLLLSHIPKDVKTALDIGTGAGVPGLLMKIIRPDMDVVLAEAAKKKCSFLKFIVAGLNLQDIYIEEKLVSPENPPDHLAKNGFDLIVSQATGTVKWFVQTASDFLAPDGSMIILKGPAAREELEHYADFMNEAGLSVSVMEARLPVTGHKRLLIKSTLGAIQE